MKRAQLTFDLAAAMASRSMVRITRKVESGAADGYVVNTSEHWLLLLLVGDGIAYAGFQALRVQDVASFEMPSPRAAFYQAVLRKRGLRRPRTPKLNLSSAQELIQSAGKRFPLITIHREKVDPEICHIGQVISTSSASVSLLEVTPDATWVDAPSTYRLSQVTRVDFGGPYEEALALVALTANPSVKGTSTSGLRPLAAAPYVER
jgi:hypothetical protein